MAALGAQSLANLAGVKPVTRERAIQLAAIATAHGGDIRIVSGLRDSTKQAQLFANMLANQAAGVDTLPAAPPGESFHETGDAFDIEVLTPLAGMTVEQSYKFLADEAPSIGLKPGLYFHDAQGNPNPDRVHFENADATRGGGNENLTAFVVVVIAGVVALSLIPSTKG